MSYEEEAIQHVLRGGGNSPFTPCCAGQVPRLLVFVKTLSMEDECASATIKDPTGTGNPEAPPLRYSCCAIQGAATLPCSLQWKSCSVTSAW